MTRSDSRLYLQLVQEGHITRSCICIGLTELRNANLDTRGRFYTGFFNISIGLERLAKLALILDYMVGHGFVAPGSKVIRNYGHDLEALLKLVEEIGARRSVNIRELVPDTPFRTELLDFFSRFANGARYANLDALAAGTSPLDPLSDWHAILRAILLKEASPAAIRRIVAQSAVMDDMLRAVPMLTRGTDLPGDTLERPALFSEPWLIDLGEKYVPWHLMSLIAPLTEMIGDLADAAADVGQHIGRPGKIPYMRDFYAFAVTTRELTIRKKKWP